MAGAALHADGVGGQLGVVAIKGNLRIGTDEQGTGVDDQFFAGKAGKRLALVAEGEGKDAIRITGLDHLDSPREGNEFDGDRLLHAAEGLLDQIDGDAFLLPALLVAERGVIGSHQQQGLCDGRSGAERQKAGAD